MTTANTFSLFDPQLVKPAIASAFGKLDPRVQWRNPVMFVVYAGSIITTILWAQALGGQGEAPAGRRSVTITTIRLPRPVDGSGPAL